MNVFDNANIPVDRHAMREYTVTLPVALRALGLTLIIAVAAGCGGDPVVTAADTAATSDTDTALQDSSTDDVDDDATAADVTPDTLDADAADSDTDDTVSSTGCPKPCDPHASCVADTCVCDPGWTGSGFDCQDVDECADGTAVCGEGATCANYDGAWTCTCPDGSEGQAIACSPMACDCGWDTAGCHVRTAGLEVVVLDIWGRAIPGASATVTSSAGEPLPVGASPAPLCAGADFTLSATAPDHHEITQTLHYAGPGSPDPVSSYGAMPFGGAVVLTRETRTVDGAQLDVYTAWVGLAHRWFAAGARPWHPDTQVELLINGEAAWQRMRSDLEAATELITISTWFWRSTFELTRGTPAEAVELSASARAHNTILGILDASPADKKVLVAQFIGQDGLFSNLNVDDALIARGEAAGDGFDFMGHANDAQGTFDVVPPTPDFGARLAATRPDAAAADWLFEHPGQAFIPPQVVDMTELPLGLGGFDIPLASWHQKFVTVDQAVAYIGGMNFNTTDWDTDEHLVFDPRRMPFDATRSERREVLDKEEEPEEVPRTDFNTRITGAAVDDAVEIFHARWAHQLAAGVRHADKSTGFTPAPNGEGAPTGTPLQVVATMPAPFDENDILETLVRAIGQAERYIFIEDQYLRAPLLRDAIIDRMAIVEDLQLIVITNPVNEWVDPGCWQTYLEHAAFESLWPDRYGLFRLRSFDWVDTDCTFCWDEVDGHFVDHSLHAKLVLIDDVYLEVGSCNHNNRGLLYEGELAVVVHDPTWVEAQRHRVFAGLIGPAYSPSVSAEDVLYTFRYAAWLNDLVYDRWKDDGFDLDLDGRPVPADFIPSGFVYPMSFPDPSECLLESIGADVT